MHPHDGRTAVGVTASRYLENFVVLASCLLLAVFSISFSSWSIEKSKLRVRCALNCCRYACGDHVTHIIRSTNGGEKDTEARLRGCLSVLVAIAQGGCVPGDVSVAVFLTRQMRLLIENSSGQHGEGATENM